MSRPISVLISDVHFTVNTLPLASSALKQALKEAGQLKVPLVIAGDLLDGKAVVRGECMNSIIDLLCNTSVPIYVIVGNHDLLSEKGEGNSLNFLSPYVNLVSSPVYVDAVQSWLVPYFNDAAKLIAFLASVKPGSRLIMHQGVMGAAMGHYVQDTTSLPTEAFADFRVISGHYHKAQDIECGKLKSNNVGLFSYIGTPYTITFAEANDGPKGFQVLYADGSLEQVPTNLRKHIVVERPVEDALAPIDGYNKGDLLWLKVTGPHSELEKLDTKSLGNVKIDKIPTDDGDASSVVVEDSSAEELMDFLIESSSETPPQKEKLKQLWRQVMSFDNL